MTTKINYAAVPNCISEYVIPTTPKPLPPTTSVPRKTIGPVRYGQRPVDDQAFTYDQEIKAGNSRGDPGSRAQGPHISGNEPRREKTFLRGFRPGRKQIGLYNHRRWLGEK